MNVIHVVSADFLIDFADASAYEEEFSTEPGLGTTQTSSVENISTPSSETTYTNLETSPESTLPETTTPLTTIPKTTTGDTSTLETTTTPTTITTPTTPTTEATPSSPTTTTAFPETTEPVPEGQSGGLDGGMIFLIVLLCLLAVGAIVAGIWYFLRMRQDKPMYKDKSYYYVYHNNRGYTEAM